MEMVFFATNIKVTLDKYWPITSIEDMDTWYHETEKSDGSDSQEQKTNVGSILTIHQKHYWFSAPQQHQIDFRWAWTHNVNNVNLDLDYATAIQMNLDGHWFIIKPVLDGIGSQQRMNWDGNCSATTTATWVWIGEDPYKNNGLWTSMAKKCEERESKCPPHSPSPPRPRPAESEVGLPFTHRNRPRQ